MWIKQQSELRCSASTVWLHLWCHPMGPLSNLVHYRIRNRLPFQTQPMTPSECFCATSLLFFNLLSPGCVIVCSWSPLENQKQILFFFFHLYSAFDTWQSDQRLPNLLANKSNEEALQAVIIRIRVRFFCAENAELYWSLLAWFPLWFAGCPHVRAANA